MTLRISGLGSGLDIDSMVQNLMKAKKASVDKVYQKRTQAAWKKADYNAIYTKLKDFRTKLWDYRMSNTLSPKKADSSDTSVLTATALGNAGNLRHTIDVKQLADGAKKTSLSDITADGADMTTLKSQFGLSSDQSFVLKVKNGAATTEVTINTATDSIYDLVNKINNGAGNTFANYDIVMDRFSIYTNTTGSATSLDFSGSDPAAIQFLQDQLKINTGATFTQSTKSITTGSASGVLADQITGLSGQFDIKLTNNSVTQTIHVDSSTDTLADLIQNINNAGAGVTASYDSNTDRVILKTSGNNQIDFTGSDASALSFLKNNLYLNTDNVQTGIDAIVDIDDMQNVAEQSNTFSTSGITYSLKNTGFSSVTTGTDIDAAVKVVKDFISMYNDTLSTVNNKVDEARYRDYLPLTDEQKNEMKESEVTSWEEKAKSGMLANDSILEDVVDKMRLQVFSDIDGLSGDYKNLASLGISTGDYTEKGKLYLDSETTLRKALETDPDILNKLFAKNGDTASQDGIATRLYDTLKTTIDEITEEAGYTASDTEYGDTSILREQIKDYDDQITDMNTKLNDYEDNLYKRFTAMESALQKISSQSSWLNQQTSS